MTGAIFGPKYAQIGMMCVCIFGAAGVALAEAKARKSPWGRLQTKLEKHGVKAGLSHISEYLYNTRGGLRTGGAYRNDISLTLRLDTAKAGWWASGEFFIHLQGQIGDGLTERRAGDFQTLSNIDADDYAQVSEFWYKHSFFQEKLWIKFGKQDANEDFAYAGFGGEFLNSSPGFTPTVPLVTYPDQDWGLVVGLAPARRFSVNAGIYQGSPNGGRSISATLRNLSGPFAILEPAFHYSTGPRPGALRLGAWWNGDETERLSDATRSRGPYGFYGSLDQLLWRKHPQNEEDKSGVGLSLQYGWAPPALSEAHQYFGGLLEWTGPASRRPEDALGLGFFHVRFSEKADFDRHSETTLEFFYKVQLKPYLALKPDLQVIRHPGGGSEKTAVVIGFRIETTF